MQKLNEYRCQIDVADSEILEAISKRVEICKKIGYFKRQHGIPMMQPDRVAAVLEKVTRKGVLCGLSRPFVEKLYHIIHEEVFSLEDDIIDRSRC